MPRGVSVPVPDRESLRKMYEDDLMTVIQIGKLTGCGRRRIRAALDLYGIEARHTGPRSPKHHGSWNGGRIVDKSGYILVKMDDHPDANHQGYVREHRYVMEQMIGRPLLPTEVVDHIDGDKGNNSPSNLRLFESNAEHLRVTLKGKCPKWTPEGRARTLEGARRPRAKWKTQGHVSLTPIPPSPQESDAPASLESTAHSTAAQEQAGPTPSQTGDMPA